MKEFYVAAVPETEDKQILDDLMLKWKANTCDPIIVETVGQTTDASVAHQRFAEYLRQMRLEYRVYKNDIYQVAVRFDVELIHLSIKRIDRLPIHDWRDLQEIKNMLVGKECEGVELYPAESRRVDTANQYHIFVARDERYRFPFGFNVRSVTGESVGKSVNRAFL